MRTHATDYPEQPYPGARPDGSFVVDRNGGVLPVTPDDACSSGWRVNDSGCLDDWLADREAPPLSDRIAVLSYGSNASPQKILRNRIDLPGVCLAATVIDMAAVWCTGPRHLDDAIPATLAPRPDHQEQHVLSYVVQSDLELLDSVEGHPMRYQRRRLDRGSVVREDGLAPQDAIAYIGISENRLPVLDEAGEPALVSDGTTLEEAQARAQFLVAAQSSPRARASR